MRRFNEKSSSTTSNMPYRRRQTTLCLARGIVIVVTHHTSAINQLSSIGREIDGVKPHTCHSQQRWSQISNNDIYPVHLLEVLSTAERELSRYES